MSAIKATEGNSLDGLNELLHKVDVGLAELDYYLSDEFRELFEQQIQRVFEDLTEFVAQISDVEAQLTPEQLDLFVFLRSKYDTHLLHRLAE